MLTDLKINTLDNNTLLVTFVKKGATSSQTYAFADWDILLKWIAAQTESKKVAEVVELKSHERSMLPSHEPH